MDQQSNLLVQVQEDKKRAEIDDGYHMGHIMDLAINERKGYTYLDITLAVTDVTEEGYPPEVKCGFPLPVTPSSMTGKLLKRFGAEVIEHQTVDVGVLKDKDVQFLTLKNDKGYTEVNRDSLKPLAPKTVPIHRNEV